MKKIYLILVVFLAVIFCSFAVATSNSFQTDINVNEMNNSSSNITENVENFINVEYDENDDSVMTLSGGYPTTHIDTNHQNVDSSVSQPSNQPASDDSSNGDDGLVYCDGYTYYPDGSASVKSYSA